MSASPRSAAQAAVAAQNARKSTGPRTASGKSISALNSVRHGLTARGALLPGEAVGDYEGNLCTWVDTLRPRNAGEGQLVSTIADLHFRLARLARQEQGRLATALEQRVGASPAGAELARARDALVMVNEVIFTAGRIQSDCAGDHGRQFVRLLHVVLERTQSVELPVAVEHVLGHAIAAFEADTAGDVAPLSAWETLFARVHLTRAGLEERIRALEAELEAVRLRVADEVLLGDDKELARLGRYRTALLKDLEAHMGLLRTTRELGRDDAAAGGPGAPLLVELRLVGQKRAVEVAIPAVPARGDAADGHDDQGESPAAT